MLFLNMIEYENLSKSNQPFEEEYRLAFERVLKSGRFVLGEHVAKFETAFAQFCSTRYCVGVGSGLDALVLALNACDFPKGSEVIVPSNTFVATIWAVLHCGLTPVLAEPDQATYNLDPNGLPALITTKTKAIIAVHLYGKMCAMQAIMELAREHQLMVIEDAAQAHGARYFGQKAGEIGHFGAFSFYPVKNLGALGDGGAVTVQNEQAYLQLKKARNYGSSQKYYYDTVGYNSRLDELQAAFLLVKLNKLQEINQHKRKLAAIYFEQLKEDFFLPVQEEGQEDVFHIFAVRHPERDRLRDYLLKKGVMTEIHYPVPPHQQNALKPYFKKVSFPISENIHSTILSLPIAYHHTENDIAYVCDKMNGF
jgi:dTDP-4-amino-4,6-dideoxygalactose transaminase